MTNPYRTLLTEMAAELDYSQQLLTDNRKATHPLADRARVLLDRHEPHHPADGDVAELVGWLRSLRSPMCNGSEWMASRFDRAADLIQHQHPQPVAVAERPWEREGWCDNQGRCWIFMPDIGTDPSWRLTDPRDVGPYHTHSLPANALPTPETTNG